MVIAEVIAGIRTTWAVASAALETRDAVKLNEIQLTMSNQLLELYTAAFSLQEEKIALANEKRELENEVMQLRQQADKLAQYERTRTPIGSIVYVDKTTNNSADGPVYACASCMDDGKISTLQSQYQGKMLICPAHGEFGFSIEPYSGVFSRRPK